MRLGRQKRAAVLGCGPAGLFAVHGLIEKGWSVRVFSTKRKSELYGSQYLHEPIPGLTESDPVTVDYRLAGSVEDYREKVYGPNPVKTSVDTLEKSHQAWDIREAYSNAWDRYGHLVNDQRVTPEFLGVLKYESDAGPLRDRSLIELQQFDVVVNSIPMDRICYQSDTHQFESVSIWAIGDAPARGQYAPYRAPENTVECNGMRDVGWYRASRVYGYTTVEWPGYRKPPIPGVASVEKPIRSDCDCYHGREFGFRFIQVGRYGSWSKGVLSHHAYQKALEL